MFIFISKSPEDIDILLIVFDALANDHFYLVRRTVACGIHEVRLINMLYLHGIIIIKIGIYDIKFLGGESYRSEECTIKRKSNKITERRF
jgi:hypothetical protein